MKIFHASFLLIVLFFTCSTSSFRAFASIDEASQFDKSTMIKHKLKKAQECINCGNYTGARNYLNGVLRLDKNNAKAKQLLKVCNNGERDIASSSRSRSSYNSDSVANPVFSVSKEELYFNSNGGTESITVSSENAWSISVNTNSWGHLTRSGNTLTLNVDANSSTTSRRDYFKLKSGDQEVKINITQEGLQYIAPYLNVSKSEMYFASEGGTESITISSNITWKISTSTYAWGHLKQEGNTLTLSVDANYTGNERTDYFVLSADSVERRINITQSPMYAKNNVSMCGSTSTFTDKSKGLSYLTTRIKEWNMCRLGAITENGSGIVIYGSNGYATTGNLNSSFVAKMKELNNQKETFKSVATTTSGYYCIVYGRNGYFGYVPEEMKNKLNEFNRNGEDIYCVSISENGDYVIITDQHIQASNSIDLSNINRAMEKYGHVKYVCITNKGLIAVCENGIYYSGVPTNVEVRLKSIIFRPDKIVFTDSGTYLITNESGAYSYRM